MAAKSDDWTIQRYTVYAQKVLGQGGYGIVYRAEDSKGNKIAAKRIDTKRKHSLPITRDVQKLKLLNHANNGVFSK